MTLSKLKRALAITSVVLATAGTATTSFAQTSNPADQLTTPEIVAKSEAAYAALTSYRDDGTTQSTIGTTTVPPSTFTIALARPGLYRITWDQDMGFFHQTGSAWSAGDGDYLKMGGGPSAKNADREGALGGATGISGGAAASVPGTFFKMNWGNQLGRPMKSAERKSDEKIGDVDCYVLSQTTAGRTKILWIGKSDFLIHQVENDTSSVELQKTIDAQAKTHPEFQALAQRPAGDIKSVETHLHIVLNPPLAKADFAGPGAAQ